MRKHALILFVLSLLAIASGCGAGGPEGKGQPTARCTDGTYSYSENHSGTCSSHGGVAEWLDGSGGTGAVVPSFEKVDVSGHWRGVATERTSKQTIAIDVVLSGRSGAILKTDGTVSGELSAGNTIENAAGSAVYVVLPPPHPKKSYAFNSRLEIVNDKQQLRGRWHAIDPEIGVGSYIFDVVMDRVP